MWEIVHVDRIAEQQEHFGRFGANAVPNDLLWIHEGVETGRKGDFHQGSPSRGLSGFSGAGIIKLN